MPISTEKPITGSAKTSFKYPILLNWIIIVVTISLIGLTAHMLTGS